MVTAAASSDARKTEERRALGVACGAHAIHDGYTDLIYVLLPVWQAEFGLSYAEVGLLRGAFAGATAAFQIPAGWLSERIGAATMLAAGTALSALAFLLVGTAAGFVTIVVLLLIGGLGSSVQHPIASSVVARAFAGAGSRIAIGNYNFAGDIGKMAFPAATALLLIVMNWRAALVVIAGIGLVAAVAIFLLVPRIESRPAGEKENRSEKAPRSRAAGVGFELLLCIGAIDSATRMAFLTFLPFVLVAKGASIAVVGLALALVFAGGAAGKLVCAHFGVRYGVLATVVLTEGHRVGPLVGVPEPEVRQRPLPRPRQERRTRVAQQHDRSPRRRKARGSEREQGHGSAIDLQVLVVAVAEEARRVRSLLRREERRHELLADQVRRSRRVVAGRAPVDHESFLRRQQQFLFAVEIDVEDPGPNPQPIGVGELGEDVRAQLDSRVAGESLPAERDREDAVGNQEEEVELLPVADVEQGAGDHFRRHRERPVGLARERAVRPLAMQLEPPRSAVAEGDQQIGAGIEIDVAHLGMQQLVLEDQPALDEPGLRDRRSRTGDHEPRERGASQGVAHGAGSASSGSASRSSPAPVSTIVKPRNECRTRAASRSRA